MDSPITDGQLEEWAIGTSSVEEEAHHFAAVSAELLARRRVAVDDVPKPFTNPVARAERMHIAVSVLPALAAQGAPPNTAAAQAIEYATALITALNS